MKTLNKIKLNQFSKNELDQRKLNALKGGCGCESFCEIKGCYPSSAYINGYQGLYSAYTTY